MTNFFYPTFELEGLSNIEIKKKVKEEIKEIQQDKIYKMVKGLFVDDSENPLILTPGELAIFKIVYKRQFKFSQLICCTQYGKTLTVGDAILARIVSYPEEWLVVVPDMKRGKILLNYVIMATAQNDYFSKKLIGVDLEERTVLNRLLEERSKIKLTYQIAGEKPRYGSIEIVTAEARRKRDAISAIMGFGGRNVIEEEAALLDNEIDAGVFRMLAGRGEDIFLLKIGNPFKRNHFLKSWQDPDYKKIFIDYRIALADGRYVESFIEKAMQKPLADVLYKCLFPESDAIDEKGWMPLLTEEEVERAQTDVEMYHFGEKKEGIDVAAGGRNYSVITMRSKFYAEKVLKNRDPDTMSLLGRAFKIRLEVGPDGKEKNARLFVDATGVGKGTYDRAKEELSDTVGVIFGGKADDPIQFFNKRAEIYWRLREWILAGGKLKKDDDWNQLSEIRYKVASDKRIQIMSKEEMLSRGIESPDVADSLAVTFAEKDKPIFSKKRPRDDKRVNRWYREPENRRPSF